MLFITSLSATENKAIDKDGNVTIVKTVCIDGVQYYQYKTERYAFSGRGYGAGYMAVAIGSKTLKPKICDFKERKKK